jgi:diguanylate cyclase (GGDEF)-like protein
VRTYKVFHLSLAFMAIVVLAAGLLALFIWQRQDIVELSLKSHEREAANEEIREALNSLRTQTLRLGKELAEWDETRQQLVYPGYYSVWRDARVKDTGRLPVSVDGIALYGKDGHILLPDNSPDPMPGVVAAAAAERFTLLNQAGHAHLLLITPVHADPAGKVLLGYLGLKDDLFLSLQGMRHFRFVDVDTLSIEEDDFELSDFASLAGKIDYRFRPNPYLDVFREVFRESLGQMLLFIGFILAGAAYLLHWTLVRPLQNLSTEIDALQHMDQAPERKAEPLLPIEELENVRNSFRNYHARLTTLHSDLERIAREFHHQAVHDSLTGVFNRRAFDSDRQEIGQSTPTSQCALLLFDCDRFKAINDLHGHDVGDAVIKAIADCLQHALRVGDRLYRLGGDEFAALLPETDRSAAFSAAERCRLLLQSHDFSAYGLSEPVSLSIGIALGENGNINMEALQKQADTAMYAAKQAGAEKIVFYDDLA